MNSKENMLKIISETNNVSLGLVHRYYDILTNKKCVNTEDEYQVFNCLQLLIQLRKKETANNLDIPFDYSLSEVLYKAYKEDSYCDLTPSFLIYNDIDNPYVLTKKQKAS